MFFKKGAFFLFSLIILFAIGCESMQNEIIDKADQDPSPDDTISVSPGDIPPDDTKLFGDVVIKDAAPDAIHEYTLEAATLTDDMLTLTLSYGGGCGDHEFTLVAANAFMESFPVQLRVSLVHRNIDDFCERWVTEAYHFDLTPIKTMYQQAYQEDAGTIVLNLEGLPEDAPALVYEFAQ